MVSPQNLSKCDVTLMSGGLINHPSVLVCRQNAHVETCLPLSVTAALSMSGTLGLSVSICDCELLVVCPVSRAGPPAPAR